MVTKRTRPLLLPLPLDRILNLAVMIEEPGELDPAARADISRALFFYLAELQARIAEQTPGRRHAMVTWELASAAQTLVEQHNVPLKAAIVALSHAVRPHPILNAWRRRIASWCTSAVRCRASSVLRRKPLMLHSRGYRSLRGNARKAETNSGCCFRRFQVTARISVGILFPVTYRRSQQMTAATDPRDVLLTLQELAARRKQSVKTVYNKLAAGTLGIPVIRLNGTEPRVRLSDVLAAERAWTDLP